MSMQKTNNLNGPHCTMQQRKVRQVAQCLHYFTFFSINSNSITTVSKLQLGNEKMVEILIKNGAQVNARDSDGQTPIMLAFLNGKLVSNTK